jgi:hypothetical protein
MLGHSIVSQHFMEPEGSIPNSQQLSTCSYPEPDQSSPNKAISFVAVHTLRTTGQHISSGGRDNDRPRRSDVKTGVSAHACTWGSQSSHATVNMFPSGRSSENFLFWVYSASCPVVATDSLRGEGVKRPNATWRMRGDLPSLLHTPVSAPVQRVWLN